MSEPLVLTNSTMKDWRRCQRKWYFGHYLRLKRKEEPLAGRPHTLGTRVHDALAFYYDPSIAGTHDGGKTADTLTMLDEQSQLDIETDASQEKDILAETELASIMLEGYFQWLEETGADAGLEVIAPESKLTTRLGSTGVTLMSKIDARLRRESDGSRLALEHKTVGTLEESVTAQIDTQLLTEHLTEYLHQLERGSTAERADGVLYNMLRKVKRTPRSKPPYYKRYEVGHNIDELRNHWRHVIAVAQQIEAATTRLDSGESHHRVVPPNPMPSCKWDCPFVDICKMANRGEDWPGYAEEHYVEHDPLERYLNVEEGED